MIFDDGGQQGRKAISMNNKIKSNLLNRLDDSVIRPRKSRKIYK